MATDKQFRVADRWALASDGVQWVVQRRKGDSDTWQSIKFIRSTKDSLDSSMTRAGVPLEVREQLIEGLPDSFDEWREQAWQELKFGCPTV